jgi:twitching motility two-component system response regulator PilH
MKTRHVLVIDDEPDVTTYLEAVLGDRGWRVSTANSADEGLERARQDVPDVILLDVMMPERGGMSTLVALGKDPALSAVPVVLVTGIQSQLNRDFEAYLGRFHNFRPDGYLEKPIDLCRLFEILDELTIAAAF